MKTLVKTPSGYNNPNFIIDFINNLPTILKDVEKNIKRSNKPILKKMNSKEFISYRNETIQKLKRLSISIKRDLHMQSILSKYKTENELKAVGFFGKTAKSIIETINDLWQKIKGAHLNREDIHNLLNWLNLMLAILLMLTSLSAYFNDIESIKEFKEYLHTLLESI